MRLNIFSRRPKSKGEERRFLEKNDLGSFVTQQFKALAKKNLRVPIQLYHL
jgi:hypothetical protein